MRKVNFVRAIFPVIFAALGLFAAASPASAQIAVGISVHIGPPALPVYAQPVLPAPGYIWTPGYWAYAEPDGYYWVPGVWVAPPRAGLLWTPGYWGFAGGVYGFHAGYWGPHVGFYGGVNYGFGYGGVGFGGGAWRGGVFAYNSAVTNVNTTVVHNTYVDRTYVNNSTVRTSFNGGPGGIHATPNAQERLAANESHVQPTSEQINHEHTASTDRSNFASENHGHPATPAYSKVGQRAENQQGRIANGVRSGELTSGETKNLESREANINHEVHDDRAANGGTLTQSEREHVNQQQNNVSHSIYDDKHNAATQPGTNSEVGQRQNNQQQRIANGIDSGKLSAGEAAHDERNEQKVNQQVHADRQANGGHLTQAEKKQVNKEQNKNSKKIHNQKANAKDK
jgi:chorismate mutase